MSDHQVSPSPNVLAHDLAGQLRAIADALATAEQQLKQHGATTHSDALAIAREHIQIAIAALALA
jgi:hypothetical protein